jgi:hypothetical protein
MSGWYPPINNMLPASAFNALIRQAGVRCQWQQAHACPCVFSSAGPNGLPIAGSAEPACQTCYGVGTYWDAPSLPFVALITFSHMSPTPDEPGIKTDERWGGLISSEPAITIPQYDPVGQFVIPAWASASTDDIIIEMDAIARYNAYLQIGGVTVIPFQAGATIAASGAVTVYNPTTMMVETPNTYTVSGAAVTLTGYPLGTTYQVTFTAAPMYVLYRSAGGLPHTRPFGAGAEAEPRKFRGQTLDIWTRAKRIQNNSSSPTAPPFVTAGGALQIG